MGQKEKESSIRVFENNFFTHFINRGTNNTKHFTIVFFFKKKKDITQ